MTMLSPAPRLHHWRSAGGAEVDLILERDGRFFPIEIKGRTKVGPNDTRGLAAFRQAYPSLPVAPGLVIFLGEGVARLNGTDYAVPWDLGE